MSYFVCSTSAFAGAVSAAGGWQTDEPSFVAKAVVRNDSAVSTPTMAIAAAIATIAQTGTEILCRMVRRSPQASESKLITRR